MIYTIIFIAFVAIITYFFLKSAVFGQDPNLKFSSRILSSKNYKNGSFQNQSPTEVMRPGASYFETLKDFINKPKNTEPSKPIPTYKIDLKNFNPTENSIVWFGHSSYLLFIDGKKILVDPVFKSASPVPLFGKPFPYTKNYLAEDMPNLDAIILTHDHYDHLDYLTIKDLIAKTKHFITPLGVDAHLISWGVKPEKISSLDWYESISINEMNITATPARHFSGRKFKRGNTLWSSYVLKSHSTNIYLGGDSGFDKHFKEIGETYGPFDLAILECGQYNKNWPNIHMFPEEVIVAAEQLHTQTLLPVHWGKFALALHPWKESIESVAKASEGSTIKLITPEIGKSLSLTDTTKTSYWWRDLE